MSSCTDLNCPAKQPLAEDVDAGMAKRFDLAHCFKDGDIGLNIFAALERINKTLESINDNISEPVIDTNLITIQIPEQLISNVDTDYFQKTTCPFDYKVIGISFSLLEFPSPSYFDDDEITIQAAYFTNFTGTAAGATPFGPVFTLTKDTPWVSYEGVDIVTIPKGLTIGFLVTRDSTQAGDAEFNNLSMYLKVRKS